MNKHKSILSLALALIMAGGTAGAGDGVRLAPLIADGMVIQRESNVPICGTAEPGEKINLSIADKKYTATAGASGQWRIDLKPMKAGGPYVMNVNDVEVKNVMVGDVFLFAGQSNMELTVARVMDKYASEVKGYGNDDVRYLKVPYAYAFDAPVDSLRPARWLAMEGADVQGFGALCYFFGRIMQETVGVPVGIVNASWGGTPIEAWISAGGLKDFPDYVNMKSIYEDGRMTEAVAVAERMRQGAWNRQMQKSDPGVNGDVPWYADTLDDSSWESVDMFSDSWTRRRGHAANGTHWLRKSFDVPAGWSGREAVLRMGCIVDADSVYVNGRFVGSTSYQYPPRIYKVPAGLLHEGKNQVTVRLFSYGGKPSFVREKPYKLLCDGMEINLEGEWKYRVGAQMPSAPSSTSLQNIPVGLYNGMIYPLRDYRFKGVAWYQGESNVGRWGEYAVLLEALMDDWRRTFGDDLPFYIVELADFLAPDDPGRRAWAELRKQQAEAVKADGNATLIKNSDTGEWNDIHPLDKKTPASRLVKAVLENDKSNN